MLLVMSDSVSPIAIAYFSPDHACAQNRFLRTAAKAGARNYNLRLAAKGPREKELMIDIAWLGAERPRRLLLHSSGIHGVEGFAGSAMRSN
jgi:hypothetical protein